MVEIVSCGAGDRSCKGVRSISLGCARSTVLAFTRSTLLAFAWRIGLENILVSLRSMRALANLR
jgi:hypothetical protein